MQIKLNTGNSTKKNLNIQSVSCRYQLKKCTKRFPLTFFSYFGCYPIRRNFVLRIVWFVFGKDNSIGKGFGSMGADGLSRTFFQGLT